MSAQTTKTTTPVEHANAVRFRRSNTAFETGDVATLHELWSPDITWIEGGNTPLAGTHRGFDNVLSTLTDGIGMLDAFAMTLEEVYADDDMSVGLYTMAFTKGGRTAITRAALAAQIVDGRATTVNAVNMNQAAVDAVMGGTVALPEQGQSTEHVNAVRNRQAFKAFQAGDISGLHAFWSDDIVWTEHGNNRFAGTHRGFDATMAMIGEVGTAIGPDWSLRLDGVAADDDCSIARFTGYYSKNVIDSFVMVSYLDKGKATRVHVINANQAALDAILG